MTKDSASGDGVPGVSARCRGCEPTTGSAGTSRPRPLHHPLQRLAQPIFALFRAVFQALVNISSPRYSLRSSRVVRVSKSQQSWVRSQHHPRRWILRGGR
jgi:hypothetical protein